MSRREDSAGRATRLRRKRRIRRIKKMRRKKWRKVGRRREDGEEEEKMERERKEDEKWKNCGDSRRMLVQFRPGKSRKMREGRLERSLPLKI